MKKWFSFVLIFFPILIHAQTPTWQWANRAGGINLDLASCVVVDPAGNSYVAGHFTSDSITFGNLIVADTSNNDNDDLFIAKYDPAGNVLWAKTAGGIRAEIVSGIARDLQGNLFITGYFSSPEFVIGYDTLRSTNIRYDVFVIKFDSNGNELWARSAGGTGFEYSFAVAADTNGNCYVTGDYFGGPMNFDTISLPAPNSLHSDIFIAKYDSSGNIIWAQRERGQDDEQCFGITVDDSANIYLTGSFKSNTLYFDTITYVPSGDGVFLAKFNTNGRAVWLKCTTGQAVANNAGRGVTLDNAGNIFITGYFSAPTISFDTIVLSNSNSPAYDGFVVKCDPSGNFAWGKQWGGAGDDFGDRIIDDSQGNIYMTGNFSGVSASFGSSTVVNHDTAASDAVIAKYDNAGNLLWLKSIGGKDYDDIGGLDIDSNDNLFVAGGSWSDSIYFDNYLLLNDSMDAFVAKLDNLTGTEEIIPGSDVLIYPNPSDGQVTLVYSSVMDEILITNNLGQVVLNTKPGKKSITLSLENEGMYFATIVSQGKAFTQKIIILHN